MELVEGKGLSGIISDDDAKRLIVSIASSRSDPSRLYGGPKSQVQKGVFGKILFLHSNDFLRMGRGA